MNSSEQSKAIKNIQKEIDAIHITFSGFNMNYKLERLEKLNNKMEFLLSFNFKNK